MNKIDEITKYVLYLKEKGYKVLPPDINKSKTVFTVENDGVRFGLSALKGAGQAVIDAVIEERNKNGDFKDFPDFVSRCISVLNSRLVEGLILSGAFDAMGVKRSQLEEIYEPLCNKAKTINKQRNSAQMNLFGDILGEEKLEVTYPDIAEYELNEKLSKEKQVLGVYVSGHPFEKYVHAFPDCTFDCSFFDDYVEDEDGNRTFNRISDGMRITMAGIIASYRRTMTKRTGTYMAFMTLEDVYGSIECVCFPSAYEKYKAEIINDRIVKVRGKLDVDAEKGVSLIIDEIIPMETQERTDAVTDVRSHKSVLWLNATSVADENFEEFINTLYNYEGESVCKIVRGKQKFLFPTGVNYCRGLLAELSVFINLEDIKFIE